MKFAIGLLIFGSLAQAHAQTSKPDRCEQTHPRLLIERFVQRDLKAHMKKQTAGAELYSFGFSGVFRLKDAADLAVYFEQVVVGEDRTSFVAQYSVDTKTCRPTLLKVQNLSPIEAKGGDQDKCNEPAARATLHDTIIKELVYNEKMNPGTKNANYAYSAIVRKPGTNDLVVFFEGRQEGLRTNPLLARYDIDPKTCETHWKTSTGLRSPSFLY